jgi:uncharacterized protein YkvS
MYNFKKINNITYKVGDIIESTDLVGMHIIVAIKNENSLIVSPMSMQEKTEETSFENITEHISIQEQFEMALENIKTEGEKLSEKEKEILSF